MKKEKSCGCVVINKDKVLLIKHNKGHWDFPKGHVEEGETETETAIREVKEETNIDVKIIDDKRFKINYIIEDKQIDKDVIYFIAKPTSFDGKPQLEEVSKVEWVDLDKARDVLTYDDTKKLIDDVIKRLNSIEN